MENYLLSLNDIYQSGERLKYYSTMVMVPEEVCQTIDNQISALIESRVINHQLSAPIDDDSGFNDTNAAILKSFREAHGRGEIFCFSVSRSKYARPVSIKDVSVYDETVEIETLPGEMSTYRLIDIYDTSKIPLAPKITEESQDS